jgi:hypothetical protein
MNPKKKSRRYRVSVSIHALDLAIYRFTHSLELITLFNHVTASALRTETML